MKPSCSSQSGSNETDPQATYLQYANSDNEPYGEVMSTCFLNRQDNEGDQEEHRADHADNVEPIGNSG